MVRVDLRAVGSTRRHILEVPPDIEVAAVRRLVEKELGLPYERLKLVLGGKTLQDDKNGKPSIVTLADGDSMIAIVAPKAPPKHITSMDGDIDQEDEDLRFKLRETATPLQRHLAWVMREKLRLPAPIAHRWDLGPLYVFGSALFIIFFNLGKRQAGEASAYSIFNEGFRELPGTLNADRLDRDIRAGQF